MRKDSIAPSPPSSPVAPAVRMIEVTEEHDGQRLDNFLMRLCKGVPKSHIYKAVRGGEVRVNKGRVAPDARLSLGDLVRVPPMRLPAPDQKRAVPGTEFPIVFEDEGLLIIDKPAGTAVHGGSGVSFGVIEALRAARPEARFLELAHRLDRDTSGLLIIAKKRNVLLALHEMFRTGGGKKQYLALVEGDWVNARQHIRLPLAKWTTQTGERRVKVEAEGQISHTVVSAKQRFNGYSLVDAELRTGRTHQIRVHLASSGFPIVGDDKYGRDETRARFSKLGFTRMFLHAYRLEMPHPLSKEVMVFEAPLPSSCTKILQKLETL
ncbi:RluA family pseudouridine synthase [Zwartia sp.]|uniref:RluA family pseudouridine synthase n=1 Tax=Zwartia sp. TaxID=2978004 RepID=UPI00272836E8|nr:RluA family pseudouridine synthase [Zwartia sp.]MDO9026086.1 RluA family pseudouridine synthase [Zwartia sp.]